MLSSSCVSGRKDDVKMTERMVRNHAELKAVTDTFCIPLIRHVYSLFDQNIQIDSIDYEFREDEPEVFSEAIIIVNVHDEHHTNTIVCRATSGPEASVKQMFIDHVINQLLIHENGHMTDQMLLFLRRFDPAGIITYEMQDIEVIYTDGVYHIRPWIVIEVEYRDTSSLKIYIDVRRKIDRQMLAMTEMKVLEQSDDLLMFGEDMPPISFRDR